MNKAILIGRLTKDSETRYTQGERGDMAISRFVMAVDRRGKDNGADFISCIAFGKMGEFFEKYGKKGTKFVIDGHIQTGSYERDGRKVYTTDVVVDSAEFGESKNNNANVEKKSPNTKADSDGFMNIVDDLEELPFQ